MQQDGTHLLAIGGDNYLTTNPLPLCIEQQLRRKQKYVEITFEAEHNKIIDEKVGSSIETYIIHTAHMQKTDVLIHLGAQELVLNTPIQTLTDSIASLIRFCDSLHVNLLFIGPLPDRFRHSTTDSKFIDFDTAIATHIQSLSDPRYLYISARKIFLDTYDNPNVELYEGDLISERGAHALSNAIVSQLYKVNFDKIRTKIQSALDYGHALMKVDLTKLRQQYDDQALENLRLDREESLARETQLRNDRVDAERIAFGENILYRNL